MEHSYIDQLNPQQREAVCCTDAPSLVIAGAGSGKTRVLTAKIAYLLSAGGMEPQQIMALTFTNKAANEMKQRIAGMVGAQAAARITMGTFHSVFARILRVEHAVIGYSSNFTIYDSSDSASLIKSILKDMQLDEKKQYKPASVLSRISRAKNQLLLPDQYPASSVHADQASNMPAVCHIYKEYQARLKQANAMDFDDLLLQTWLLFHDHPQVADKYQRIFHYILVDEYQDTNYAQHQIVLQLTQRRQRICVVGDDAQSIYSFRGAEIDNILHFQEAYQGSRLFKLEQNYRSTQTIVDAASSLIKHNRCQIPKQVFSRNHQGRPIEVFFTYSDIDEASTIVRYLTRLNQQEHLPFSEMAILYRTNSQSRSFEEELRRREIPYRIYGGLSFYQRKEIKDAIAYLRLCVNPHDETALSRVVNYPARGIGDTTLGRVWQAASAASISPWEVMLDATQYGLTAAPAKKLAAFTSLIRQFQEAVNEGMDVHTLIVKILTESGMQADIFRGCDQEDINRQQNIQELSDSISGFVQERQEQGLPTGAADYLQEVSLLTDQTDTKGEEDADHVSLMTVHSSKGLEFKAVCVVGLEENLFPGQSDRDDPRGLEEERRLFYVAMTRAGEHLSLSCARSRMRYGHMEFSEPSRFLGEIDPSYLHVNGKRAPYSSSQTGGMASPYQARTARPQSWPSSSPMGRPASGQMPASDGLPSRKLTPTRNFSSPASSCQPQPSPLSRAGIRRLTTPPAGTGATAASSRPSASREPTIQPGQKIAHDRFGLGIVEKVEGSGIDARATVAFETAGRKQLLLRFARFKLV